MASYDDARTHVDAELTRKRRTFLERIECWKDTQRLVAELSDRAAPPSRKRWLDLERPVPPRRLPPGVRTRVAVEDEDSIDCGLRYLAAGFRPVVLNLADDCMPGGCVDIGSGAQEESLFRRTALCATLHLESGYPLLPGEGIYSPDVAVLKGSEADGWRPLAEPFPRLAFLTVPGLKYPSPIWPADVGLEAARLRPEDVVRLEIQVRLMLQMAADEGHDCVVLGASGCGAWKCPPRHVADVMLDVVARFDGVFRVVTFAILKHVDDNAASKRALGIRDNHAVFTSALVGGSAP